MCKECKKRICPPNCPNFKRQEQDTVHCASCGEPIDQENGFYQKDGFPYCESCLDFADTETLIRICETSKREWLKHMGFTHKKAEPKKSYGRIYDAVSNESLFYS